MRWPDIIPPAHLWIHEYGVIRIIVLANYLPNVVGSLMHYN